MDNRLTEGAFRIVLRDGTEIERWDNDGNWRRVIQRLPMYTNPLTMVEMEEFLGRGVAQIFYNNKEEDEGDTTARPGPGQAEDNYVYPMSCGHELDSPRPMQTGDPASCSQHGETYVTEGDPPAISVWPPVTPQAYDRARRQWRP